MQNYINKIKDLRKYLNLENIIKNAVSFKEWFLGLSWDRKTAFLVFLGLVIYLPFFFFGGKDADLAIRESDRQVEVVNVGELSNISSPLSLVGSVQSVSEATVRGESSGQLVRVYKKVGDRVFAGETIATFENSSERAAVLSAEGAYEQAKAARDISLLNNGTSATTLDSARVNASNALSSAFITMDDVVRSKTDIAFSNPKSNETTFKVLIPNQSLQFQIETERKKIENILVNRQIKNGNISSDLLLSEIDVVLGELNTTKRYLDNLASAYAIAIPNNDISQATIDAQKTIVGIARSTVVGSISSLTGSKQALVAAETSSKIGGTTQSPSTLASDAAVKIALGSYQAALARLSKTVVRSPISGTVNSITVKTGDYAVPSQTIAIVGNNGALEITTYVTNDDAKRIVVGQEVLINGKIEGVVTRVASAIDTLTRKMEIKIGVKRENVDLTNGQSVRLEIKGLGAVKVMKTQDEKIKIPLSAVKMTPRGSFVFFVEENKLRAQEVKVGAITGANIEIISGLGASDNIVLDARGLKDGQMVEIKSDVEAINN